MEKQKKAVFLNKGSDQAIVQSIDKKENPRTRSRNTWSVSSLTSLPVRTEKNTRMAGPKTKAENVETWNCASEKSEKIQNRSDQYQLQQMHRAHEETKHAKQGAMLNRTRERMGRRVTSKLKR